MSKEIQKANELTVKPKLSMVLSQDSTKKRFEELLGKKAQGFISSILQLVNSSNLLAKAEPTTILTAAATAAILDLPINQSFGYAYIVPYNTRTNEGYVCMAQFQIGWKGLVQLALRTGQYLKINAIPVYENQFKSFNSLTEELDADMSIDGTGEPVGYVAYFKLLNGFEKTVYWSRAKVLAHAKKYSKSLGKGSTWDDVSQFDGMACKTVLKNALSKFGILSIEMQTAIQADQSVQKEEGDYRYPDNAEVSQSIEEVTYEKGRAATIAFIQASTSLEQLAQCQGDAMNYDLLDEYQDAVDFFNEEKAKSKK